jgi:hypothetical protein
MNKFPYQLVCNPLILQVCGCPFGGCVAVSQPFEIIRSQGVCVSPLLLRSRARPAPGKAGARS